MRSVLRHVLAFLLLPVCVGSSLAVVGVLSKISWQSGPALYFLGGMFAYLAFHAIVPIPKQIYVFAHELTHAAAVWLSGGEVKSFKVSAGSGAVAGTKGGGFVALAPYLIPTYTLIVGVGYFLVTFFSGKAPDPARFLFFLGASLAFHLAFTAEILRSPQSDLSTLGYPLSLVIIYLANLFIVAFIFYLVFRSLSFWILIRTAGERSWEIYQILWRGIASIKI